MLRSLAALSCALIPFSIPGCSSHAERYDAYFGGDSTQAAPEAYYLGGVRRTYRSRPYWIVVALKSPRPDDSARVRALAERAGLRIVPDIEIFRGTWDHVRTSNKTMANERDFWILAKRDGSSFARFAAPELRVLREDSSVAFAGPVIRVNSYEVAAYDNHVCVSLDPAQDKLPEILASVGLARARADESGRRCVPQASCGPSFDLRADDGTGEGMSEIIDRLSSRITITCVSYPLFVRSLLHDN